MSELFLGSESVPLENALFSIIPAPSEQGATYFKGQKNAPQAIYAASAHLETFDEEFGLDLVEREAIHSLPTKNAPSGSAIHNWLAEQISNALAATVVPIIIGGDGTVSYTAIKTLAERAQKEKQELSVLHIDAHADLDDLTNGENNLNTMRKVLSIPGVQLHELGVRSLSKAAFDLISDDENNIDCFFMSDLRGAEDEDWQDDIVKELSSPVYVSLDLSALATGLMPNVGNPEPGGFNWQQITSLLRRLAMHRRIAAFDILELCSREGMETSDYSAARLIYKSLNAIVAGGKMLDKEEI